VLAEPALEPQHNVQSLVHEEPTFTLQLAAEPDEPIIAELVPETPVLATTESKPVQPLSAFTVASVVEEEFRPRLEVDRFAWPEAVTRLNERSDEEIQAFVEQLATRSYRGERLFSVLGMHRGVGATTALLAVARQLSKRRLRTVIVDAKFSGPMLAPRLGVAAAYGWEQIYNGALPLEELVIASVEDGMSLVPLDASASASELALGALHVSVMFGMLRDHFDVVLLDAGTMDELGELCQLLACGTAVQPDGAYLVYDRRSASDATIAEACRRLAAVRLEVLGCIENFVARECQSPKLSIVG
jgi:Mrp family chromosome partitioning ATPase